MFWNQNKIALQFFDKIAFWEMEPRNDLIITEDVAYCLAKENEIYAIYVEANASEIKLNLGNSNNQYSIKWFDPRNGGKLQNESIVTVSADGLVQLGTPPLDAHRDWLIFLKLIK